MQMKKGYLTGIANRACKLVISAHCNRDALTQVRDLMAQMHAIPTTSMSPHLYPLSHFHIPDAWTVFLSEDPVPTAILALFEK